MQGASLRVIWYIPEHLQGVVSSEELRDDFQRRRTAVHRIELGVVGKSCHIRPCPEAIKFLQRGISVKTITEIPRKFRFVYSNTLTTDLLE